MRKTAEQVFIPLTVGGGIRAVEDVDRLLRAGADKVSINTAAIALTATGTNLLIVKDYWGFLLIIFAASLEWFKYWGRQRKLW